MLVWKILPYIHIFWSAGIPKLQTLWGRVLRKRNLNLSSVLKQIQHEVSDSSTFPWQIVVLVYDILSKEIEIISKFKRAVQHLMMINQLQEWSVHYRIIPRNKKKMWTLFSLREGTLESWYKSQENSKESCKQLGNSFLAT